MNGSILSLVFYALSLFRSPLDTCCGKPVVYPSPPRQGKVVYVLYNKNLTWGACFAVEEVVKRFDNPVLILAHGYGHEMNPSELWIIPDKVYGNPRPLRNEIEKVKKIWPDRPIVCYVCNPKNLEVKGAYYFKGIVYVIPDCKIPYTYYCFKCDRMETHVHETISNYGGVGSIWEAVYVPDDNSRMPKRQNSRRRSN